MRDISGTRTTSDRIVSENFRRLQIVYTNEVARLSIKNLYVVRYAFHHI